MTYVLVVDDDEGIRELVTSVLQNEGLATVAVAGAAEALQFARQRRPGLVLLDTPATGMSDAEFIREFRALPGVPAPVLFFSAWADPEQHAAAIGADGVIVKPFELGAFVARIRQYLPRT